ncbi:hypothetical protein XarbCFBP8149_13255 [Xanthomonas arboricola]|nr:hypothetical protein XarbCFBP8149_13255 [Xanthomonas arboricola]
MPRKSLQGCTCGVSRDGRQARTLQPGRRSAALELAWLYSRATRNPGPPLAEGACPSEER